jgi:L-serine/L-threonine ammonia-lyase
VSTNKYVASSPSGHSLAPRGIGYYILRRLEELPRGSKPHIFASSGGNAGLAAVHSARALGLPCTVVVPTSTSALMVTKLRAAGAHDVIQYGAAWQDADTYLKDTIMPQVSSGPFLRPRRRRRTDSTGPNIHNLLSPIRPPRHLDW